jgi:hypothetical protein
MQMPDLADLTPDLGNETPKHLSHPLVQHKYKDRYEDEDLLSEMNEKNSPEFILDLEDKF